MIYLKPFRIYRRRIIHRKGVIDHTLPREGIQTSFILFPDLRYFCLCGNSFVTNWAVIYLVVQELDISDNWMFHTINEWDFLLQRINYTYYDKEVFNLSNRNLFKIYIQALIFRVTSSRNCSLKQISGRSCSYVQRRYLIF